MADRTARLGELERRVLAWLWGRDWVDVRAAHAAHATASRRSPNTIHSTLERLIRKGLVERRREGRAFAYRAIVSRDTFVGRELEGVIERMPGTDPRSLLAAFVDLAARLDDSGLDELERLVAERRRAQSQGGGRIMSEHLASIAALASLWLAFVPIVALVTWMLWPRIASAIQTWNPEDRARLAFFAAIAPALVPSAIVVLCALPGIAGALTGAGDHCTAHGDHPHFCPIHATLAMTPLLGLALGGFTALSTAMAARTAIALRTLVREQRWLARRRAADLAPGIHLLAGDTPLALTHGLRSPGIWISQALLAGLSDEEREVVIGHERAHAARRDPARLLVASITSTLQLPSVRAALLRELRVASEQACDARAAAEVGDRLRVASTLLCVERLMQRAPCPMTFATSVLDSSLPARIEALLAPRPPRRDRLSNRRSAWILTGLALLLASPIHHLAEHVLEAFLRSMVGLHLLS